MPTPTFKLLLNALRLGQPQDPQAAIFALVEALSAQEEVIEELRRRVQVVQSAAQILETKAARLEMDLDAMRSHGATGQPDEALSARHPSQRPLSLAAAQQQHAAQQQAQQQQHAAQLAQQHAAQYAAQQQHQQQLAAQYIQSQQAHRSLNETQEAPSAQEQQQQQQQAPPQQQQAQRSASARPPPPRIPSEHPPPIPQAAIAQNIAPSFPKASPLPRETMSSEESSGEDFGAETMVVHKKDLEFLKNPDAPFRLPPPGQRRDPGPSIPGAPWARGASPTSQSPQEQAKAQQRRVHVPVMDEFTAEAAPQQSFREEGDDETYRDAGGVSSLAAALGLAPDDPRIQKLRSSRTGTQPQSPGPTPEQIAEARRTDSNPPPPKR